MIPSIPELFLELLDEDSNYTELFVLVKIYSLDLNILNVSLEKFS